MGSEINDKASNIDDLKQKLEAAYDYEVAGKLDEALQLCEEVIQVDPNLAEAYNLHGIILEQLGRKPEAVESYTRAVQLDADFEEASENLAGLQAELEPLKSEEDVVYVEGRDAYKEDAIYVAKWGALAFGLALGILMWVEILLNFSGFFIAFDMRILQFLPSTLLIGLATAVLGSVSSRNPFAFGVAGGIGYFAGSLVGWGVFFQFILNVAYFLGLVQYINFSIFVYICVGIVYGAVLGLVTKDYRQIFWLALAGAVGFMIYGINYVVPLRPVDFGFGYNHSLIIDLIFLIPDFIIQVLKGAILGAMLGGVLGWFSDEVIVDENDEFPTEENAIESLELIKDDGKSKLDV